MVFYYTIVVDFFVYLQQKEDFFPPLCSLFLLFFQHIILRRHDHIPAKRMLYHLVLFFPGIVRVIEYVYMLYIANVKCSKRPGYLDEWTSRRIRRRKKHEKREYY